MKNIDIHVISWYDDDRKTKNTSKKLVFNHGHIRPFRLIHHQPPSAGARVIRYFMNDTKSLIQANIIDLLELRDLPIDQRDRLLAQMGEMVQERVMDQVLTKLSDAQKQELDQALEQNSSAAVDAFLQANVPDLEAMVAAEAARLKLEMVDDLAAMKAAVKQS